jgi:hypothetical protein
LKAKEHTMGNVYQVTKSGSRHGWRDTDGLAQGLADRFDLNIDARVMLVQQLVDDANSGRFGSCSDGLGGMLNQGACEMRERYPDVAWSLRAAVASEEGVLVQYVTSATDPSTGRMLSWTGTVVLDVDGERVVGIHNRQEDLIGRDLQLGRVPRAVVGGITGKWLGSAYDVGYSADLFQSKTGEIWGEVALANGGTYEVVGQANGNEVELVMSSEGQDSITFRGTTDEGQLVGRVPGIDRDIVFHRN